MLHDSSDETLLSGMTQEGDAPHDKHPDELQRALPSGPQPVIGIPIPVIQDAQGPCFCADALGGSMKAPSVEMVQPPPTTPETWDRHRIRVRSNSTLAGYLSPTIATQQETSPLWELAFVPHQGVARLADGLRSCAQSDDVPIVAFERRDAAFGLGMIGRLDWGLDHAYGITLVAAFIQASKTFHQTRQQDQSWEARRDEICAEVSARVTQGLSLLSTPQAPKARQPPPQTPQRSGPRAIASTSTSVQERLRQRAHPLTKAELNQRRRQRLKAASR